MKRVLVCGDRKWTDGLRIYNILTALKAEIGPFTLIEGGARGADILAWEAANDLHLHYETFDADWKGLGRKAGPIRNRRMLDTKPDLVLAFHDNLERSLGTRDCVTEARRRGIEVRVVTSEPA